MSTALFDYYEANKEQPLGGTSSAFENSQHQHAAGAQARHSARGRVPGQRIPRDGHEERGDHRGQGGQHPLVYAEWLEAPGKPTLLIYGHYDVQPADPLDEWTTPPFEPTIRNNNIYARGAVDDKGQVYLLAKAVEGFFKTEGKLPLNVKFLIEGEEEVGGEFIDEYVVANPDRLKCDAALVCDTELFAPELPTLNTGLRGLVYTELEARAAAHDLHSGMYGGAAPNPMQALAEMINKLKGPDGKILIPGFYKRVKKPTAAELASWKSCPSTRRTL